MGWKEHLRSSLRLPVDLSILAAAFYLSYLPQQPEPELLALVVIVQILVLQVSGARRYVWRRFSLEAAGPFFFSVLAASFVILIVNLFLASQEFDLTVSVILHDCLYAFCGLMLIRIQRRIQFERSPEGIEKRKILEYEAAEAVRLEMEGTVKTLEQRLEEAQAHIEALEDERRQWLRVIQDSKKSLQPKLVYRGHDGHRIVYLSEVKWVESNGVYVDVHTEHEKHVVRMSMNELEESHLDPDELMRIHRQYIVRVSEIDKIESTPKDKHVVLKGGQRLTVSREHWKDLKARIFP